MFDLLRVQKELKEIEKDKASGVTVTVQGNNLQHLIGCVGLRVRAVVGVRRGLIEASRRGGTDTTGTAQRQI